MACASTRTSASAPRSLGDVVVDLGELGLEIGGARQRGERLFRFASRGFGFVATGAVRCLASLSAEMRAALRLISRSAAACSSRTASVACCASRQRARASASAAAAAASAASAAVNAVLLRFDFAARGRKLAFDRLQAAALGEPPRCAGRRMRGGGKAIPAPKVAFARYQPLAGLEHRRKARAVAAFDDADLGEAARKFRRRLHKLRQRRNAVRQSWIGRIERRARPAHRCGLIDRRIEIVAKRGAERLLVTFGDGERVHHRRP